MSKPIQLRQVPDQLHRTLKARAAREGMTLSGFLKRELSHIVERRSLDEWLKTTRRAKPIRGKQTPAQIIRKLRDSRSFS